jgi:DNA-binding Lrp family transcriptional regulator
MKNEQELINLLKENSRRSVSDLAKNLGLSRATVQQGIERLERKGIIQGYTVKINPHYQQQQVSAYIMISIISQKTPDIVRQIQKHPQLDMLCTISGQYDLMAMVTESTTEALDRAIDSIAALDGVEKTLSHIVLSRKKALAS